MGNGITTWNFDYKAIPLEHRQTVIDAATRLRQRISTTGESIIEIGRELLAVKSKIGHGRWGEWLRDEFKWSERTAQQFMLTAQRIKCADAALLESGPAALQLLASNAVPDDVREQIIQAGQPVTRAAILAKVAEAKPTNPESGGIRMTADDLGLDDDGAAPRPRSEPKPRCECGMVLIDGRCLTCQPRPAPEAVKHAYTPLRAAAQEVVDSWHGPTSIIPDVDRAVLKLKAALEAK